MMYRYELHCHESLVSKCGKWTPAEMVKFYSDLGYTGIVVTDHFFNSPSCLVPDGLSWQERIEMYCAGYEETKKEGEKVGLDVFFAFEYTVNSFYRQNFAGVLGMEKALEIKKKNTLMGCDFLIFGLDKEWLLHKGEYILEMPVNEFMKMVRDEGGTVIQAHPFRLAKSYMDHISLFPDYTDGVEILNGNPNTVGRGNKLAEAYAEAYEFFPMAGSDAHFPWCKYLAATDLEERISSVDELITALRERRATFSIMENPHYEPNK